MAHPEWALKFKTKGTELRNIGGRYYLYRISSRYDKERKVTRKITHEMIGRITEQEGLIPRGQRRKKSSTPTATVRGHGATHFLQSIGSEIFAELKQVFPDTWKEIAVLAMNRLIYAAPVKNCEFLYTESFLAETFGALKLDKNTLTNLITEFGQARDKIGAFLEKFVAGKEKIIFDATNIFSSSANMKMNAVGYNSQRNFDPQVNLLYMFSVEQQQPIFYRIFPGNISGVRALKLSIQEAGVAKCTVVGDKGFASEENFTMLEESQLQYLFPLKRDSKLIDYDRLKSREYQKAFEGHFLYQDRPIFYYQQKVLNGRQVTVFHDPKLKLDEETSYLKRIQQKLEGYTIESYQSKQLTFGTIAMTSNIKGATAEELYIQYKHRMEIEGLFDAYKTCLKLIDLTCTQMQV